MSREQTSKQEQISIFGNKAKGCRDGHQKIEFFDLCQEVLFTNSNESTLTINENALKDLDDSFYVYANMKMLNETKLEELRSLIWK